MAGTVGSLPACRFYEHLQTDKLALAKLTLSYRRMWEEGIEACCRHGRLDVALQASSASLARLHRSAVSLLQPLAQHATAMLSQGSNACCCQFRQFAPTTGCCLQIFDDWKTASVTALFVQQSESGTYPYLSRVTLAFLQACCSSQPAFQWRVYDVLAQMRQQAEHIREAALDRPKKTSHHFLDACTTSEAT